VGERGSERAESIRPRSNSRQTKLTRLGSLSSLSSPRVFTSTRSTLNLFQKLDTNISGFNENICTREMLCG